MLRVVTSLLVLSISFSAFSQTAKRYITLEHFTNTLCSVCKNNNPSLFATLNSNPGEVHHISIHSEIPYTACIYFQHNTAGNNYRKNLYGDIFGTPTTYTNGTIKGTGAANLLPQSRVDNLKGQTSPVRIQVSETINGNMLNIQVKVKTYRPLNNPNLKLFVAITEKYIQYNAPNGETDHHNVFRKMLPGNTGGAFIPAALGQEVTQTFSVALDAAWQASEVYAYVFLQDTVTLEIVNSGTKFDLIVDPAITPADCAGAGNGAAALTVTGGTPPYGYNWSNAATASSVNGLNPGVYTVTVSDNGGFEYVDSITIPINSTLQTALSYTPSTANNGTATVNASGGTAPYTYQWSNGNTTQTATGLATGYAYVTVTDDNGCTKEDSIYVSMLSIAADIEHVSCFGGSDGSVSLSVTGGNSPYTYTWSVTGTGDSIGGLSAGTYMVTILDNSSSAFEGTYIVQQPADITINISTTGAHGTAADGTATATVSGGTQPYTYSWTGGGSIADVSQLTVGSYTVTVTDAHGCEKTATATVEQLTGVDDIADDRVKVYPNPANNRLYVEVHEDGWLLELHDLAGRVVVVEHLEPGVNRIDLNTLPEGMYVQRLANAAATTLRKLIIAR